MNKENRRFLLYLAYYAIDNYLKTGEILEINDANLGRELKKISGTFVTLTINNKLRGCIGNIFGVRNICEDVIQNAICAAFEDPRFTNLTKEELSSCQIEISILNKPEKLDYSNANDLLKKIKIGDGLIIGFQNNKAIFLPQVWEELADKELFLSHLCLKARLPENFWQNGNLEVQIFKVEKFTEKACNLHKYSLEELIK